VADLLLVAHGGFPPGLHALFIAKSCAQSQRMNHSRRSIRAWYNSVIQHVIAQSAVAIFGPQRGVAALVH